MPTICAFAARVSEGAAKSAVAVLPRPWKTEAPEADHIIHPDLHYTCHTAHTVHLEISGKLGLVSTRAETVSWNARSPVANVEKPLFC